MNYFFQKKRKTMKISRFVFLLILWGCLSCQNQTDADKQAVVEDPVTIEEKEQADFEDRTVVNDQNGVETPIETEDPVKAEDPTDSEIQSKSEDPSDSEFSYLVGTKWNCEGIMDTETGKLKTLEPKYNGVSYSIWFDAGKCPNPDCNILCNSSTNELFGYYKVNYATQSISFTIFGGTKVNEIGDGEMWRNIFPTIKSFSLQNDMLHLYFNDQKNYLLFKKRES
jgi:hypothetical protein